MMVLSFLVGISVPAVALLLGVWLAAAIPELPAPGPATTTTTTTTRPCIDYDPWWLDESMPVPKDSPCRRWTL